MIRSIIYVKFVLVIIESTFLKIFLSKSKNQVLYKLGYLSSI